MMEERIANLPRKAFKYERVVEREVCQVSTKGTRVNNFLDSENFEGDPRQAFFASLFTFSRFYFSFFMQSIFVNSEVFRIQIHCIRIRLQAFWLIRIPDPDSCF